MPRGWWKVDIDGQVFYAYASAMASAVSSAILTLEHRVGIRNMPHEALIGVERCETPEGKKRPNPRNWLPTTV